MVTIETLVSSRDRELWEESAPSSVPDLILLPVDSESEVESFSMMVWRAEQWSDALAGEDLSTIYLLCFGHLYFVTALGQ